jgi:hypothetical protein
LPISQSSQFSIIVGSNQSAFEAGWLSEPWMAWLLSSPD